MIHIQYMYMGGSLRALKSEINRASVRTDRQSHKSAICDCRLFVCRCIFMLHHGKLALDGRCFHLPTPCFTHVTLVY
jgi:hypothetical protein